ncbi:helix-turn-helix domain-containing protein [Exiguobacterium sp. TDN 0502]|uniref:helix-turn-helix domain-containing protein n=1 Tax=Exiguobacterium sp. TDN 0502 TaxID=3420731 RepID=UPI003D78A39C
MVYLPESIGYEIKRIRKEKKMTQAELCEGICSQAEISKVENGKNSPTIDLLQQVAKRLKVPLSTLFQDHLRSDAFHEVDDRLLNLIRLTQWQEALEYLNSVKRNATYDMLHILADYYEIIILEKCKHISSEEAVLKLEQLLLHENLWFKSSVMYLRIRMKVANVLVEHDEFETAEVIFQELLQLNYETIELKKKRIKILYNYSQLLWKQKKYQAGLAVTEQGIQESLQMEDGHFLGHFYHQRGTLKKQMKEPSSDIQRDFTMAYAVFHAFHLPVEKESLLEEHETDILFRL